MYNNIMMIYSTRVVKYACKIIIIILYSSRVVVASIIMHNIMHTRSYAYMHVLAYYALYSYSVDSMYIEQFGLHTLYAYSVRARWHTMSEWAVVNT